MANPLLDKLEPEAVERILNESAKTGSADLDATFVAVTVLTSIALSMKRIADAITPEGSTAAGNFTIWDVAVRTYEREIIS